MELVVLLLLVLTQLKHQFLLQLINVLYALGPTVTGEEDLDVISRLVTASLSSPSPKDGAPLGS